MGSLATVSDDVYEANINDIQAVQSQIEEENYVLDNTKSTHDELTAKKEELSHNSKSLDTKIVSLNKEISTKEQSKKAEAERAAAEQAKAEADRVAAQEARAAQEKAEAEQAKASTSTANTGTVKNDNKEKMVWKTKSGKKYHSRNNCGNTDSSEATQITCYRHNDNSRNKAGR